jgi:branched-chain amino acid transport system permease protein
MSKTVKIILILIAAAILLTLPLYLNPYVLQIVILTVTYAMLGLTFAMGLKVGLLRFDVAAWWAVGAYSTALLVTKAGWNFFPAMLAGGVIAVVLGFLVCLLAIPRGMMVFFLVGMVITMVFYQVFGSVSFFGSWGGIGHIPYATIGAFKFDTKPELFYLGMFFLVITLLVYYLLYNSKIGTAWNAVGSSLKLANSVGIDVVKYRFANILIGNFFLAIVGSYYVGWSQICAPQTFSFNNSVFVMMYVIVGGINHCLIGPLIGSLIITFIPEYFMRSFKEYQSIIQNVFIILIIIFLPNGLLGLIDKHVTSWFKHSPSMARFRAKATEEPVPAAQKRQEVA